MSLGARSITIRFNQSLSLSERALREEYGGEMCENYGSERYILCTKDRLATEPYREAHLDPEWVLGGEKLVSAIRQLFRIVSNFFP